ncbi:MAG: Gfo/Idh/MocA family oxidoreductase, partial [Armatimonadaceae bacterium]
GLEVEDTLAAALVFDSGALGTLEASTACQPGLAVALEVSGDRGSAVLVNDRIDFWEFADTRPEDETIRAGIGSGRVGGGAADPRAITAEGHRRQIQDFCRALRGGPGAVIDGTEASAAVSIIEACYRAARSGNRETVDYLT